jgi:transposase
MKRYRYRKITPEDLEEMKRLREEGLSYKEIAKRFNVTYSTALYHLSEREKEMNKKRAMKSLSKLTKKQIKEKQKKQQPYRSAYYKDRYNNDEEFRKGLIKLITKSLRKRRNKWVKKGLCSKCGRKREEEWKQCNKCREQKKRSYHRNKK